MHAERPVVAEGGDLYQCVGLSEQVPPEVLVRCIVLDCRIQKRYRECRVDHRHQVSKTNGSEVERKASAAIKSVAIAVVV